MIEEIRETHLCAEDESRIADLLRLSFPTDYGGRSYFQQRPTLRLVWREGTILGHFALFQRVIRLDGRLTDVLGLGDIATAPEARGRGIASALMDRAIALGEQGPARFLVLFGDRGLYDRAGFKPASNPCIYVDMTGARTGSVTRGTSRFLRVRPTNGVPWPEGPEMDFLGPLF